MEWLFKGITLYALLSRLPGIVMIVLTLLGAGALAWAHRSDSTAYRFNLRDLVSLLLALILLAGQVGGWLLIFFGWRG